MTPRPDCPYPGPTVYRREAEELRQLINEGWDAEEIAARRGVCEAALLYALGGKRPPCGAPCVPEPLFDYPWEPLPCAEAP